MVIVYLGIAGLLGCALAGAFVAHDFFRAGILYALVAWITFYVRGKP
jgi:hypothetical protein